MINIQTPKEIKNWDREFLEAKYFSLQFITSQAINHSNEADEIIIQQNEERNHLHKTR